ncbi:DUF445 domain-containing protein [Alkaliphilus peptidifermentans]|uniref:DUF445 domain-containing protein n=1 Tax=Alkaliphilus peptidifermentans DSM 18978 TaxID=1120976 RepID=A0A1G5IWR8_9FIRM|nr:DUF445 family protein [Alkaliphilus peptidifermentans]SCY80513.1 Protein of unknown function [Alkaliphilus peptidifermentans DSM 18978]
MDRLIIILLLALIGALIGWITNLMAIKLLFRPFKPVKIPLLPFYIQGLIPKRKSEMAKSIGITIQEELLSIEEIIDHFIQQQNKDELVKFLKEKINNIINHRLPIIIPSTIRGMINSYVSTVIEEEASEVITLTMEGMIHKAATNVDLASMVEDKINDFPMEKLEAVVLKIAKEELKHIEILGGVLGFIIGLSQGIIILFM